MYMGLMGSTTTICLFSFYISGDDALLKHPWFHDIDWEGLENGTVIAEFIPDTTKGNFNGNDADILAALDLDDGYKKDDEKEVPLTGKLEISSKYYYLMRCFQNDEDSIAPKADYPNVIAKSF